MASFKEFMGAGVDRSKDYALSETIRSEFYTDEGKKKRTRGVKRFFAVTLILVIVTALLNWGIITDWGNVKITRTTMVGRDGHSFSALLYVPESATDAAPAPAIINFHGNAGNARNHESWAVEFARRGFVVLSVDQFGSGDSEQYMEKWGFGDGCMVEVGETYYNYLLDCGFVDENNIIAAGHSMGCTSAMALGGKYNAKAILSASVVTLFPDDYKGYWESYQGSYLSATGDVESTPEKFAESNLKILNTRKGFENVDSFQLDTLYGSFEEGNAYYATLDEKRIHEAAFVNSGTIGKLLWFGQEAVDNVPNYIDGNDQVWMYKDYIGLFGILCFGAFICAVALAIIEMVPAFAIVRQPLPRNVGLRKGGFAFSAVCGILFPWLVLKTGVFGLLTPKNKNAMNYGIFNFTYANVAFYTVVGMSLLGVLTLILFLNTDGKEQKLKLWELGLAPDGSAKLSAEMILKTLAVALMTLAVAFGTIKLQETLTGTDFYAWFFGFKSIPLFKIPHMIPYILIWIACFVVSGIGMNVERRLPSTGKEWLDDVLAVVVNVALATFTIVVIIAVKWHIQSIGQDNLWLFTFNADTQRIWGMPAGMAVGVGGSTYLFRKTGNTWLTAMLMGTVAALCCVLFGQLRFM
ncbi:MAG: hypothetical protein IJ347_09685 [Faecalibacterium sp.]|nr:hypothetical protein [Faecalibacterium sp.]